MSNEDIQAEINKIYITQSYGGHDRDGTNLGFSGDNVETFTGNKHGWKIYDYES